MMLYASMHDTTYVLSSMHVAIIPPWSAQLLALPCDATPFAAGTASTHVVNTEALKETHSKCHRSTATARLRLNCACYTLLLSLRVLEGAVCAMKSADCPHPYLVHSVEECISERECKLYDEGLNSKVKLSLYRMFSKNVGFKKYLHGVSDAK